MPKVVPFPWASRFPSRSPILRFLIGWRGAFEADHRSRISLRQFSKLRSGGAAVQVPNSTVWAYPYPLPDGVHHVQDEVVMRRI
jgi:hypothetical protein